MGTAMAKREVTPQTARMLRDMSERLGDLEGALRTISMPGARANGVPFTAQPSAPTANPMAGAMMEQMLGALDPGSQGQMRSLWAAMQGGGSPQSMAQACEPILAKLAPQDQATARMMMGMMAGQAAPTTAPPPAPSAAPPPTQPPPPATDDKLDKVAARAEAAMQEAQRAHVELANVRGQVGQVIAVVDGLSSSFRELVALVGEPTPKDNANAARAPQKRKPS